MDNKPKKMNYAIGPIRKILLTEAISDELTKKKAEALGGKWIKVNEHLFALTEEAQTTFVHWTKEECGCTCNRFKNSDNLLCEHIIKFRDLESVVQLTIESPDCRWLRRYLSELGWYTENRWLYPGPDSKEPDVVAELPPIEESEKPDEEELEPVNEDKPLDIGVGDEPEPKMVKRKCDHCGFVSKGYDRDEVLQRIAEHRKTCPKNPANKKTRPAPVVAHGTRPKEQPTVEENATDEKPSKKYTCKICGTEYNSADDVLNCIERCKEAQELSTTKALMAQDTISKGETWTDAQLEVMRKTVAANATPEEFAYFLNVAKYSGLNPFLKEIYFVKNEKGQTTIITGRDGYLTITKRDPRFEGIQSMEVCETDIFEMSMIANEDGTIRQGMTHQISNFKDRGVIIGAWARGKMQGEEPVIIFASMSEYDKSKNPMGGKIWKQYPSSMIRKVAESMALKRIAGISGLVTEAEIGGSELVTIEGGE